jgi:hypothetical protein
MRTMRTTASRTPGTLAREIGGLGESHEEDFPEQLIEYLESR